MVIVVNVILQSRTTSIISVILSPDVCEIAIPDTGSDTDRRERQPDLPQESSDPVWVVGFMVQSNRLLSLKNFLLTADSMVHLRPVSL